MAIFFVLEDFTSLGYALKYGAWYYWLMTLYNVVSTYVLWKAFVLMHKEQAPNRDGGARFGGQESRLQQPLYNGQGTNVYQPN